MSSSHYNFNLTIPENETKIDSILAKMSIDEKVGQTMQVHIHEGNRKQMVERIKKGQVGSVLPSMASKISTGQKIAVEESRLVILIIFGNDVIHGYRTIFPIPLAESCTWNLDLIEKCARIAPRRPQPMASTGPLPRWSISAATPVGAALPKEQAKTPTWAMSFERPAWPTVTFFSQKDVSYMTGRLVCSSSQRIEPRKRRLKCWKKLEWKSSGWVRIASIWA